MPTAASLANLKPGRKPGAINHKTALKRISIVDGMALCQRLKITPIDIICTVMAGGPNAEAITDRQYRAAVDAAPFLHPKLQAIAVQQGPDAGTERRKSLLAALPYHVRREIAAILEAAELQDANGAIGRVVEAIAEHPDNEDTPDATE